jgi:AcrR family transcriptional regulator
MSEAVADAGPEGRKRLIEAAIRRIGRDGFDGASVRDIAEDAGVSLGLMRFYFGSKEGLREAAEAWVVELCLERVRSASDFTRFEDVVPFIDAALAEDPAPAQVIPFLRRAFIDGRPMVLEFVRALIVKLEPEGADILARYPGETWAGDPVLRLAQGLGLMLMAPLFETALGRDVYSRDELLRLNAELFRMRELMLKGLAAEAAEAGATP